MYLTFDVGTTSVKTSLFDGQGRLMGKSIRNYELQSPQVDWYEVEPELYWKAVLEGFRETLKKSGVAPKSVKTICGCSQGETIIFLDKSDRSIRPAIVWLDNRPRKEVAELKGMISTEDFYHATGCLDIETTFSALKVLWLKHNEPENFGRIAKLVLVEDYIVYRLTGRFLSTLNLLHSTAFVHIHRKRYWSPVVELLEVADALPEIVPVGSVVGSVKATLAEDLGLSKDTMVVKGAMDQTTSAVGAGNVTAGVVSETTGTALAVGVTVDSVDRVHPYRLPYQPHALADRFLILPYAQTAGILYKWFRDNYCQEEILTAGGIEEAYEEMNRLSAVVSPGADGLVLLPFFAGAFAPENDLNAKGVLYGLTLKHGKAHVARAIQESVGYMLRKILAVVSKADIHVVEVRSMGGAARSDLWMQIKADICNLPLVRMQQEETSTLGCAILAAVVGGEYASAEEAVQHMVRVGESFSPNRENVDLYSQRFKLYNELYQVLAPVYKSYAEGGSE